jgi:hypothetical protein
MWKYLDSLDFLCTAIALIVIPIFSFRMIAPWLDSMRNAEKRGVEPLAEGENPPLNDMVRRAIAAVEALGFSSLGTSKTVVRTVAGYTYHLISADRAIHAEVIHYMDGAAVSFTTMLEDGSVVETSTPIGENFRTADLWSDWTRGGLQAAYALHRQNMAAFLSSRMSKPWLFQSLTKIADRERLYRARHFRRKLRPGLIRSVRLALSLALTIFSALVFMIGTNFATSESDYLTVALRITGGALIVGGVSLLVMFYSLWQTIHHAGRGASLLLE